MRATSTSPCWLVRKTQIADVFALVFLLKLKPGCVRVGAVGRVCHRATIRLKTAKEREEDKISLKIPPPPFRPDFLSPLTKSKSF